MANPQISGVALAHVPPTRTGMVSAVTMIARQADFVPSIAALGATLGTVNAAAGFAAPFALAAFMALLGVITALMLVPASTDSTRPDVEAKTRAPGL